MTPSAGQAYDTIGHGYAARRRADPGIAARIVAALGDARSVVDVGGGTGSYEPADRDVVAVEPSRTMLAQRPAGGAAAVRGVAEALPFRDATFDAAMAILTVHHWRDFHRGVREMRRVARRRVVVLTWDRDHFATTFWFARDYVPEVCEAERGMATLRDVTAALRCPAVEPVPVPHDCADGFFGAYWRRPEGYLDTGVRAGISVFAEYSGDLRPLVQLRADLESGAWAERYASLTTTESLDLGYRIIVASAD